MLQSASPVRSFRRARAPAVDPGALARFGVVLICLASAALAIALSERHDLRDAPVAMKAMRQKG